MAKEKRKFYITTSIAYTNALPHIGFALELVQADVLARYHRVFLGEDVFFLTGTDEHGLKIERKARKEGKTPEELTDRFSSSFLALTKVLNISNNDFIRTTDKKRHWPTVEKIWKELEKRGDIYKKKYKGLYCVGCEAFIKEKDLIKGECPDHRIEPELVEEENYFFKLSKYSNDIKKAIEKGNIEIIPKGRKNEMLAIIKTGIQDVSFSRPKNKLSWGIPVPGDNSQTIYVWADALVNYLFPKNFWPADIHCLGKDILKFHALIWPGMLFSLGLPRPKKIFVHGFITSSGQKMSKSLGNVIDPSELIEKYGADPVRYFLLREIPPTEDGDFTHQKFEERYNADLAKGLGNLLARVLKISEGIKINDGKQDIIEKTKVKYEKAVNEFKFNEALSSVWEIISYCDKIIEKEKPWEGGKEKIVAKLLYALDVIANLINPFLPETSERIKNQLKKRQNRPLFPRI